MPALENALRPQKTLFLAVLSLYFSRCNFYQNTFCSRFRVKLACMIIPVRCFTCGKVIGDKWDDYINLQKQGVKCGDALTALGLHRICCRRMLISHSEQTHILLLYNPTNHYENAEVPGAPVEEAV